MPLSGEDDIGEAIDGLRSLDPCPLLGSGLPTLGQETRPRATFAPWDRGWRPELPLIRFAAAAKTEVAVPLLVGTASIVPDLGYAVPAGAWGLQATLDLEDGRHLLTPVLPLTVRGPVDS